MRNSIVLLVVLSMGPARGLAVGQTPAAPSQERQEILAYQLTMPRADQLITAMQAMTQYVVSLPDFQDRVVRSMKMTPAGTGASPARAPAPSLGPIAAWIAEIEAEPKGSVPNRYLFDEAEAPRAGSGSSPTASPARESRRASAVKP